MVAANDESDLALFLPKRPSGEVSELLLGRLKRFMAALEAGGSLNASLKQRKNYRNPDFLAKMVEFEGIWEYGTVFKPSQFDPVSDMANSRDSFKGLAHELRALEEKRRQERTKVEFVTGWLDPKEKEREGRNGRKDVIAEFMVVIGTQGVRPTRQQLPSPKLLRWPRRLSAQRRLGSARGESGSRDGTSKLLQSCVQQGKVCA